MSRYIIAADIAGLPTRVTAGSDRMTAAAVTIRASTADEARVIAKSLPKWRDADEAIATRAIKQMERSALGVGIASMTKPPAAWEAFFAAAKPLQDAIVAQDRSTAGFVKPANVAKFVLLGHAYTLATTQAIKVDRDPHIKDSSGLDLIECTIVCDTEIEGEENLAVFRFLWAGSDQHQPRLNSLGLRTVTKEVIVTSDEKDPLIRLADFTAGIAHSALIPQPGRIGMPVEHEAASACSASSTALASWHSSISPSMPSTRRFSAARGSNRLFVCAPESDCSLCVPAKYPYMVEAPATMELTRSPTLRRSSGLRRLGAASRSLV